MNFARNFLERGELGAAFAVVRDGEAVVDLWAASLIAAPGASGVRTRFSSCSRGQRLVAVCVLVAVERGLLDLESSVARYWPEFGKNHIRVREVMSHTARLPGIDAPVTLEEFADPVHMARLMEAQAPSDDPRAGLCYHAFTYGWLCGELVRRVDGRPIGRFFAEEIAAPLELELWMGLPEADEGRVSTIELAPTWPLSPPLHPRTHARDPLARSIWGNPATFDRDAFPWERPRLSRR